MGNLTYHWKPNQYDANAYNLFKGVMILMVFGTDGIWEARLNFLEPKNLIPNYFVEIMNY